MGCQHLTHSGALPSIFHCGRINAISLPAWRMVSAMSGGAYAAAASARATQHVREISMAQISSCSQQQAQCASDLCCAGNLHSACIRVGTLLALSNESS